MEFCYMKISTDAKDLKKAHLGDAGFDICSIEDTVIDAQESKIISTGIVVAVPEGYYARVASRSGLAVKNSIEVGAGVIDFSYRGEVMVLLRNHSKHAYQYHSVKKGDKIAQLVLEKIYTGEAKLVESLDLNTERGTSGFGSTGV